jgi:hypothetical protein
MSRNALKTAETIDGALVPALTKWDLKILKAVPAHVPTVDLLRDLPETYGVSVWRVAEAARELDCTAVLATLRGLDDRRLVTTLGYDTQRLAQRWMRTEDGEERVAT